MAYEWIPQVVGTLAGSYLQRQGNKEALAASGAGTAAGIAALNAGNTAAINELQYNRTAGAPGTAYLQRAVARDPYTLTPAQKIEQKDVRRQANAGLAKSGLRGSGRAVTASFNDVLNRYRAGAIDTNLNRGQQAASQLAGQAAGASTGIANVYAGGGRDTAALYGQAGDTAGNALVSNASLNAETVGSIAGIIAEQRRQNDRASRYRSLFDVQPDSSSYTYNRPQ